MFRHPNCEYSLNTAGVMVKTVTTPVTTAILAAILDFSESSRVIPPHPLDSQSGPSYLSKNAIKWFPQNFEGYPGLATGLVRFLFKTAPEQPVRGPGVWFDWGIRKRYAMCGSVVMSARFPSLAGVAWHNKIKLIDERNFAILDHFDV